MKLDKNLKILMIIVGIVSIISICIFGLQPGGDTISYLEAIDFLTKGTEPTGLIFNRIITTFGGLSLIIFISKIIGSVVATWIGISILCLAVIAFFFYKTLLLFFEDEATAFWGTLFLILNYSMVRFGVALLMDINGWMFYIISIYFVLRYLKLKDRKAILWASFFTGIGAIFKEYALLGAIPVGLTLVYENRDSFKSFLRASVWPVVLGSLPIILLHIYVYQKFHYSYLDWLAANQATYVYNSRILEYIKSFGSLLNILGILFVSGLWIVYKEWQNISLEKRVFLSGIFLSFLPIFLWPAITQRILFITIPTIIFFACFSIHKIKNKTLIFVLLIIIYALISYTMDSFILKMVNLPF